MRKGGCAKPMSRPRQIIPGQTVFVTRRCSQRQFLLKPGKTVNQVFLYYMERFMLLCREPAAKH